MSSVHQRSRVDEEDDLDDLDDVLDQFSQPAQATVPPHPPSASSAAATSPQPAADPHDAAALTNELAAELAKEMESLLNGLRNDPGAGVGEGGTDGGGGSGGTDRDRLAATWEAMLVEGMNAMAEPSSTSHTRTSADAASQGPSGADFQERIRSTMNRLHESESELQPSDPSASAGDETLESLLAQFKDLGNLAGGGEDSELQGVLEEMMGQLMSKDVLYEPLKELHEKFPGYLAKHANTISTEDKARYEAQISCIKRLINEFEATTYRDEDDKAREKIVELMSELQTYGSPPEEIMGPLPPGFSMGRDGLPDMPDGCNLN